MSARWLVTVAALFWASMGGSLGTRTIKILEDANPGTVLIEDLQSSLNLHEPMETAAIGNSNSKHINLLEVKRIGDRWKLLVKGTNKGPDREAVCDHQGLATAHGGAEKACTLEVMLLVGRASQPQYVTVKLELIDVNDHSPTFPQNNYQIFRIPEFDERQNAVATYDNRQTQDILLPAAYDRDLPLNGVQNYRLAESNLRAQNDFEVLPPESPGRQPTLRILGKLDREQAARHLLHVLAEDGGNPRKTGTLTVELIVTDKNDNQPHFEPPQVKRSQFVSELSNQKYYTPGSQNQVIGVLETIPINTRILSLRAADPDEGDNGRVTYRFVEPPQTKGDALALKWFSLTNDNGTGVLSVKHVLDADDVSQAEDFSQWTDHPGLMVQFTIEATDTGSPALSSQTRLSLLILNVNDNSPTMSVQYIRPQTVNGVVMGVLEENTPAGVTVAHLNVHDADYTGPSLLQDAHFWRDNCMVNDSDFLLEEANTGFASNVNMLQVIAKTSFDREKNNIVQFMVTCKDRPIGRSAAPNTGSQLIQLKVLDVNDQTPQFSQELYAFRIAETDDEASVFDNVYVRSFGRLVGQVSAVDADEGENARTIYRIRDNLIPPFEINENTGEIWAEGKLDREERALYRFEVEARDASNLFANFSVATVEVVVLDVNDNRPKFYHDSPHGRGAASEEMIFRFNVSEASPKSHLVGQVHALDADECRDCQVEKPPVEMSGFGDLLFRIDQSSLLSNTFSIQSKTGQLYLNSELDREAEKFYEFRVLVTDNPSSGLLVPDRIDRTRQHTSTATVLISVTDVNDNRPRFQTPLAGQEFWLHPGSQSAAAGATLFTALAEDPDEGDNATIRYSLESTVEDLIEIDAVTGVCYLKESITMEKAKRVDTRFGQPSDGQLTESDAPVSQKRWLGLALIVRASDLGMPERLNTTRIVRLVLSATPLNEGRSAAGQSDFQVGFFRSMGLEKAVIPAMVGTLLVVVIACGLLLVLFRCRGQQSSATGPCKWFDRNHHNKTERPAKPATGLPGQATVYHGGYIERPEQKTYYEFQRDVTMNRHLAARPFSVQNVQTHGYATLSGPPMMNRKTAGVADGRLFGTLLPMNPNHQFEPIKDDEYSTMMLEADAREKVIHVYEDKMTHTGSSNTSRSLSSRESADPKETFPLTESQGDGGWKPSLAKAYLQNSFV